MRFKDLPKGSSFYFINSEDRTLYGTELFKKVSDGYVRSMEGHGTWLRLLFHKEDNIPVKPFKGRNFDGEQIFRPDYVSGTVPKPKAPVSQGWCVRFTDLVHF